MRERITWIELDSTPIEFFGLLPILSVGVIETQCGVSLSERGIQLQGLGRVLEHFGKPLKGREHAINTRPRKIIRDPDVSQSVIRVGFHGTSKCGDRFREGFCSELVPKIASL